MKAGDTRARTAKLFPETKKKNHMAHICIIRSSQTSVLTWGSVWSEMCAAWLHLCMFHLLSALYTEIKQGTSAEEENVSISPSQGMCFITFHVRRQLWPKKMSSSHHKSWRSLQLTSVIWLADINVGISPLEKKTLSLISISCSIQMLVKTQLQEGLNAPHCCLLIVEVSEPTPHALCEHNPGCISCLGVFAHGLVLCDTCGNLVDLSLPTAGARQTLVFSYFSRAEECSLPAVWWAFVLFLHSGLWGAADVLPEWGGWGGRSAGNHHR